jgi:hypothetical protein
MFEPDGKRCALGYPNADHRGEVALEDRTSLVFCKEFDLA